MASRRPTEPTRAEKPRTVDPTPSAESATAPATPRRRSPSASRSKQASIAVPAAPPRVEISDEARRTMIAEGAYLRAERRGFTPGYEVEDWLAAEKEVDALLRAEHVGGPPQ